MAWLSLIGPACMVVSFVCLAVVVDGVLARAVVTIGAAASGAATVANLAAILAKAA